MAINIYGAFRSDSTMTNSQAQLFQAGTTFEITQYSQITISDGADPTIIDGDNISNEDPNDPTQTYLGEAFAWDYTIQVNDGVNTYEIGVMDWDQNGDLRRGHIGIWRFARDERTADVGAALQAIEFLPGEVPAAPTDRTRP